MTTLEDNTEVDRNYQAPLPPPEDGTLPSDSLPVDALIEGANTGVSGGDPEATDADQGVNPASATVGVESDDGDVQVNGSFIAGSNNNKKLTSRYRGVCWNKKNKRWQAAINSSGRYLYLGSYVSEEEAARAFDRAVLKIRGMRGKLNFNYQDYVNEHGILIEDERLNAVLQLHERMAAQRAAADAFARQQSELASTPIYIPQEGQVYGVVAAYSGREGLGSYDASAHRVEKVYVGGLQAGWPSTSPQGPLGARTMVEPVRDLQQVSPASFRDVSQPVDPRQVPGAHGVPYKVSDSFVPARTLHVDPTAYRATPKPAGHLPLRRSLRPLAPPPGGIISIPTVKKMVPPGCELDSFLLAEKGMYGVLYSDKHKQMGAGLFDGAGWHEFGLFDSESDAQRACRAAVSLISHLVSRLTRHAPAPAQVPQPAQKPSMGVRAGSHSDLQVLPVAKERRVEVEKETTSAPPPNPFSDSHHSTHLWHSLQEQNPTGRIVSNDSASMSEVVFSDSLKESFSPRLEGSRNASHLTATKSNSSVMGLAPSVSHPVSLSLGSPRMAQILQDRKYISKEAEFAANPKPLAVSLIGERAESDPLPPSNEHLQEASKDASLKGKGNVLERPGELMGRRHVEQAVQADLERECEPVREVPSPIPSGKADQIQSHRPRSISPLQWQPAEEDMVPVNCGNDPEAMNDLALDTHSLPLASDDVGDKLHNYPRMVTVDAGLQPSSDLRERAFCVSRREVLVHETAVDQAVVEFSFDASGTPPPCKPPRSVPGERLTSGKRKAEALHEDGLGEGYVMDKSIDLSRPGPPAWGGGAAY